MSRASKYSELRRNVEKKASNELQTRTSIRLAFRMTSAVDCCAWSFLSGFVRRNPLTYHIMQTGDWRGQLDIRLFQCLPHVVNWVSVITSLSPSHIVKHRSSQKTRLPVVLRWRAHWSEYLRNPASIDTVRSQGRLHSFQRIRSLRRKRTGEIGARRCLFLRQIPEIFIDSFWFMSREQCPGDIHASSFHSNVPRA